MRVTKSKRAGADAWSRWIVLMMLAVLQSPEPAPRSAEVRRQDLEAGEAPADAVMPVSESQQAPTYLCLPHAWGAVPLLY